MPIWRTPPVLALNSPSPMREYGELPKPWACTPLVASAATPASIIARTRPSITLFVNMIR